MLAVAKRLIDPVWEDDVLNRKGQSRTGWAVQMLVDLDQTPVRAR